MVATPVVTKSEPGPVVAARLEQLQQGWPAPVRLDLSGAQRTTRILADVPTALEAVR